LICIQPEQIQEKKMNETIDFLNKATTEELQARGGFTVAQVKKIAESRPFHSEEDCARIKWLDTSRLESLAAALQASEMTADPTEKPAPETAASMHQRWPRILWRVFLALLVLAALFCLFYFGIPWFNERVLNPLQNNTSRVSEVASQQAADVQALSQQIATLQARVSDLETRADSVDQAIEAHSQTLADLAQMQDSLQAGNSELSSQFAEQLSLTRAIELLSRCRLYLSQSNFSLAQQDAASTRALLYSLLPTISPEKKQGLTVAISRLDLALGNLPTYPVVAVYDIDIAWQLLVDGLPEAPELVVTPIIQETLPANVTPLPDQPTITPIP
jgi:DNA-binding transcriptional MerR regulator